MCFISCEREGGGGKKKMSSTPKWVNSALINAKDIIIHSILNITLMKYVRIEHVFKLIY